MSPAIPYVLFFVSGLAGLVFETVFLRQLVWTLGSSAAATAIVLAAFMAGLALGAFLFGGVADRSPSPLRLYGLLEIGAAASGAALVWILADGRDLLLVPARALGPGPGQRIVDMVLAFGLVLVPTIFMGGTLPALSRHVIRDLGRLTASLGLLYGLNTLGAATGVFLTGFFLLETLGVSGSAWLAAGLLLTVAALAFLVAGRSDISQPESSESSAARNLAPSSTTVDTPRWVPLTAAAAGGFAVLGYEVVWTRLLSLFMRSFSYSFSVMLSLFLLGLVLGALLLVLLDRRFDLPPAVMGWVQIAMGLYVAASLIWLPSHLAPVQASSFNEFLVRAALKAAVVVLPPTILSGLVLPLATRALARRARSVGGDVGTVYGFNTAGAIAGALVAGLGLLPTLGAPATLAVLASINAVAGAIVVAGTARRGLARWCATGVAVVSLIGLLAAAGGNRRFVEAFLGSSRAADRIGELLFFHEGAADTVAIVRKNYGFHDPQAKSLITNGIDMSATVMPVRRYMAAEGHLPLLFARAPRRALAVGIGTGITLGAVASHDRLESITAVELSDGVLLGLPFFEHENDGVYSDPRVRLVREDGRHYMELVDELYDVITLEPPPPIVRGSVHLYSLDFYELCSSRLSEGGVVAQWLPLHAQSLESARMTARTFLEAFPHVTLWLPSIRDAVLIGANQPLSLELDRVDDAFASSRTRANLRAAYVESPEALLATFLLDRAGIEAWVGEARIITDEHPWMEFFRHQGGNMSDGDLASLLEPRQGSWSFVRGLGASPLRQRRILQENAALRAYVQAGIDRDPRRTLDAINLSTQTEFYRYGIGCASEQLKRLDTQAGGPEVAKHLRRCSALPPRAVGTE